MDRLSDRALGLYVRAQNTVHRVKRGIKSRLRDERGATTVEYALLIAVIVIGIIAAATYMFDPLKDFFKDVVKKVKETAGLK
ncbi:Flp family type IVb pilin [Desulfolutivibrio sulfoxidireducens]|uniref:Flp family type IVb pilin n=1 Tax=Desulfolutivibrio sulfoxidireducens TaxID=2773299 RepID=UPI00159D600E|nr:Flp family type IVb pilin [Desulfolutivibrio sulfoxidireducens]QLA14654.1 Flp family type IVb pilin [Desulfolutivibrio sulfoxidireducens]QLA18235.1 Flp family type IVb pilin [Desulfolutivibrio sulfoxidireducens]